MNMQLSIDLNPRKKRFRLTLRVMMLLVLLIGGGIGWIAYRARVQRDAVKVIKKAGGVVTYDWQLDQAVLRANRAPRGPRWLREAVGPEVFDTVYSVLFQGKDAKPDDRAMAAVGRLRGLKGLGFAACRIDAITPAGFAHLRELDDLTDLATRIQDATPLLAGVSRQTHLTALMLANAVATDADMVHIGRALNLREIDLDGRNLTQRGFESLRNLHALTDLGISRGRTDDLAWTRDMSLLRTLSLDDVNAVESHPVANAHGIWRLRKLRSLVLANHRLIDADLEGIEMATELVELLLPGSDLTDAGIQKIAGLPRLRAISVRGRGITDVGLARLAQIPSLIVIELRATSVRDLRVLSPALPTIRAISIRESSISDEQLALLAHANLLNDLTLESVPITDAGLVHLANLPKLRELHLDDTAITDAGLKTLANFPALLRLSVSGTAISDDAIDQLRKSSPQLTITKTSRSR